MSTDENHPSWVSWNHTWPRKLNHSVFFSFHVLSGREHMSSNHLASPFSSFILFPSACVSERSEKLWAVVDHAWLWLHVYVHICTSTGRCLCVSAVLTTECVYMCICVRVKVCTLWVVRVNKRSAAGTHVALLSELREKTNCFFTLVWFIPPSTASSLSVRPTTVHTHTYTHSKLTPAAPNSTHGSNQGIIFSTPHGGILITCLVIVFSFTLSLNMWMKLQS